MSPRGTFTPDKPRRSWNYFANSISKEPPSCKSRIRRSMRVMEAAPFNCAMAGWWATRRIPLFPSRRRSAHREPLPGKILEFYDKHTSNFRGERPGSSPECSEWGSERPISRQFVPVRDAAVSKSAESLCSGYRSGTGADEFLPPGSTHSRGQTVHRAQGCYLPRLGKQSGFGDCSLQSPHREHGYSAHRGWRIFSGGEYRRGTRNSRRWRRRFRNGRSRSWSRRYHRRCWRSRRRSFGIGAINTRYRNYRQLV